MIFILMIKFLRKNILCVCIRTPIPKKKKKLIIKRTLEEMVSWKSFQGFSFKEKGFGFKNPMILIKKVLLKTFFVKTKNQFWIKIIYKKNLKKKRFPWVLFLERKGWIRKSHGFYYSWRKHGVGKLFPFQNFSYSKFLFFYYLD